MWKITMLEVSKVHRWKQARAILHAPRGFTESNKKVLAAYKKIFCNFASDNSVLSRRYFLFKETPGTIKWSLRMQEMPPQY